MRSEVLMAVSIKTTSSQGCDLSLVIVYLTMSVDIQC